MHQYQLLLNSLTILALAVLCSFSLAAQAPTFRYERDYSDYIHQLIGGQREVTINSGRVDLLTDLHAFEVERAPKWKNAIGQSLWYALNTNRKPGIILIISKPSEYKYLVQLSTALEYANLKSSVDVYAYPTDFQTVMKGKANYPSTPDEH